ncbi:hypothetical protein [Rugosimonospora africana]|uniref:hypothetical protein n=1 Tax=Rugosimonospora africana TaxID=556532 RepID=UPI001941F790|nr:hypothetical protein [Rugosimonospora africana]
MLPASLWRIATCTFHVPIVRGDVLSGVTSSGVPGLPLWLYVILLSIVSELLAFTAVGLISTWGEVFPRWVPVLRGRRVPTLVAVVPAALGAAVLTLLWTWVAVTLSLGLRIDGRPQLQDAPVSFGDWKGLVAVAAYAPLLLWGPLLAAVTVSYWRRRRRGGWQGESREHVAFGAEVAAGAGKLPAGGVRADRRGARAGARCH